MKMYFTASGPSNPYDYDPYHDNSTIYKVVATDGFDFVDRIYNYASLVTYIKQYGTTSKFFEKSVEYNDGFDEISYFINISKLKSFSVHKSQFIVNREVSIK